MVCIRSLCAQNVNVNLHGNVRILMQINCMYVCIFIYYINKRIFVAHEIM
jgi:hypothetical protein